MAILVTGGAGYIGSATVERLLEKGAQVVVIDNLFRGHLAAVPQGVPFYEGRVGDVALVQRVLGEHAIESVVHFAALAYVGESVLQPAEYFEKNTSDTIAFAGALVRAGVRRFVFSSTCATYGEPEQVPIPETSRQWPKNPYGWSKLILEQVLRSYDEAYGLKFVALRYFNAAGATKEHGEFHEPESHLIPNVLSAAMGEMPEVKVFGTDYPTQDGTAIRDYVHVTDLADAHIAALEHLRKGGASDFINLGTGDGYSVLEVIETARKVTGAPIPVNKLPRRPGDPVKLVADARKAKAVLGWTPQMSDLESILRTQWEWRKKFPKGYHS
ncbi:MAG TPA: UDP-glucose 4-epimerase GalE [Candidatus Acidoferrum sp.]|jgi:UDP-glucose 4-epimerase|nr:UDP-glucose 4-epimerase GalE [Candidatus Acidoferrum sp.]